MKWNLARHLFPFDMTQTFVVSFSTMGQKVYL